MNTQKNNPSGFLLIDKPTGITSFKCIARLKRFLPRKIKIGHTGTLDSFATGLLIIAIDRTATRHISKLMNLDKVYVAQGKLGQLTDTLDFTGQLIEKGDGKNITDSSTPNDYAVTEQDLRDAISAFGKSYIQTPPIYSALKHKGWALSELMRKQKLSEQELQNIAEQKAREVQLYNLELVDCMYDSIVPDKIEFFTIKAHVSHGTYIRVLINDIAQKVGTVATTHELRRTSIGPFSVDNAVRLYDIESFEDIQKHLLLIEHVMPLLEKYTLPYAR